MKAMQKKIEKVLETAFADHDDSSWSVYDCGEKGGCYELSGYSPAGENVVITVRGRTFSELADDAEDAWNAFDADTHAAEICTAKNSGNPDMERFYAAAPDSLRDLQEDAEAIDKMYERVYEAFRAAA